MQILSYLLQIQRFEHLLDKIKRLYYLQNFYKKLNETIFIVYFNINRVFLIELYVYLYLTAIHLTLNSKKKYTLFSRPDAMKQILE